ncbi:type II toxin-antitoxin system RelE/ParE family toxin [Gottfriedia acidiceleris]|uniref:type II toxin-antitoxin system RelE/ParE family toxin n=1 Tax=Gottfriedia acidiceleris TaxID=371036 RepID=UPI002FFE88FC
MFYKSEEHPHILFSEEVHETLNTDKRVIRNEQLARKIENALDTLNEDGTDPGYHPRGNLENLGGGWWSLRIRCQNDFWRIMFRRVDSTKYGLAIMFLKKENKITKQNWNAAKTVAKREGWL